MSFTTLFDIALGAILINNFILVQFLGICPFLGVSKKLDTAFGMSCAVTVVMIIATAVTWPIYMYILVPQGLEYLQTLVFILVIAALVQLLETVLRKYMPPLYNSLGIYLPLITTNCAVLGVALIVTQKDYPLLMSVVYAIATAAGFTMALVLFAGIRTRLDITERVPAPMRGVPVALIVAGLLAMAFMGFAGMKV